MRDLYDDFSSSNYFTNLSKNEKRKYNKSYFCDYVTSNSFLSKYGQVFSFSIASNEEKLVEKESPYM